MNIHDEMNGFQYDFVHFHNELVQQRKNNNKPHRRCEPLQKLGNDAIRKILKLLERDSRQVHILCCCMYSPAE